MIKGCLMYKYKTWWTSEGADNIISTQSWVYLSSFDYRAFGGFSLVYTNISWCVIVCFWHNTKVTDIKAFFLFWLQLFLLLCLYFWSGMGCFLLNLTYQREQRNFISALTDKLPVQPVPSDWFALFFNCTSILKLSQTSWF